MKFGIRNRWDGSVLFELECGSLKLCVEAAVKHGADLRGANLRSAKNAAYAVACTRILPEGSLIGWKKLADGSICKVRIPEDAKRSHAFGRKCRAEFVDVIEGKGFSMHDNKTEYAPGLRVPCHQWDEDNGNECSGGIHFYITKEEAEHHQ